VNQYDICRRFLQELVCISTELEKDLHAAWVVRVEWAVDDPVQVVLDIEFRLAAQIENPILPLVLPLVTFGEEPPDFRQRIVHVKVPHHHDPLREITKIQVVSIFQESACHLIRRSTCLSVRVPGVAVFSAR
jgi:hypothetical protein